MLNRAKIVDDNFKNLVKSQQLPEPRVVVDPAEAGLDASQVLELFHCQLISRLLDLKTRELKEQNQSFYTIGSSGHEGNAAIAAAFRVNDMAFLHYRDAAFLIQRLRQLPNVDAIYDLLLSFCGAKTEPIAGGRHKVLGSVPAFVPPQTSTIASHCPKAVGTAFSISLAKTLKQQAKLASDGVVLCSFGDASLNHSVTQGALNAAAWITHNALPLPLVFICEDNGIGISVPTPNDWVENNIRARSEWHYLSCDGLNILDTYRQARQAQRIARHQKQPVFLHMKCVRLLGHAGSDIEHVYLKLKQIEASEAHDPLLYSARILIDNKILSAEEILELYESLRAQIDVAAKKAVKAPKLIQAEDVMASITPPARQPKPKTKTVTEKQRQQLFGKEYSNLSQPRNLCQLINYTLTDLMAAHDNMLIFGEDVAKKGGVYRVTAELEKRFGRARVFNSLLDETTILGQAIGLAHNGFLPIPEIQFLAYYHNAEDQIRGEAASLSFFSQGQYTNPMVVRIASLAYQKGFGGHFHNDNSIAVLRDIPGIIVACPSHGADAAKMLRQCVALAQYQQRVVIFLEPIALYMTKDLHQPGDGLWLEHYPAADETIELGNIHIEGESDELAIITYGNGYYLSRQAQHCLEQQYGCKIKVIDLRWLVPLPETELLKAIANCANILIVDECRQSGSVSEALMTLFIEKLPRLPGIKRITGKDCFIPLGSAWQQLLPSRDDIINTVVTMLACEPLTVGEA